MKNWSRSLGYKGEGVIWCINPTQATTSAVNANDKSFWMDSRGLGGVIINKASLSPRKMVAVHSVCPASQKAPRKGFQASYIPSCASLKLPQNHLSWFQRHTHTKSYLILYLSVACSLWDHSFLRIEPIPSAVGVWSLNHWTAKEVPSKTTLSEPQLLNLTCHFE